MIRMREDILALKSRVIGWGARNTVAGTQPYWHVTMALQNLSAAAEVPGSRRDHMLRMARGSWRIAVRLTAEGAR